MTEPLQRRQLRSEDARLLRGRARFVDNVHLDRMVHGAFVRSTMAHAKIVAVNSGPALAAGALAVFIAQNLPFNDRPWVVRYWHPNIRNGLPKFLATDRVRYVGEPIAFVVADSRYLAEDFAQLVEIEYEPLPVIASLADAMAESAERLHAEWVGNVAAAFEQKRGDAARALAESVRRIRRQFSFGRQAPVPLETRGVVADFDAERNALTVWQSTQPHYNARQNFSSLLGIPELNVRVIAEDVGGGFGSKSRPYPEEIVAAHASRVLQRPVKWIEDRFENLQATTHSRAIQVDLEIGCDRDARFTAMKAGILVDIGAYVFTSGIATAEVATAHIAGAYRFPNIEIAVRCVGTNKTPIGTYRGAGQPEVAFPLECLLDLLAKELGIAAADLRRRNLVQPKEMPYTVGTVLFGNPMTYESADFPGAFERAIEESGYHERVQVEANGERIAYGLACGVETAGLVNFESAQLRVDVDGTVTLASGISSQGQGQRTTYAQVCAETLGVPFEAVRVQLGDTQLVPFGRGAFAARGAVMGANAVLGAAQRLRARILAHAGTLLQCADTSLDIEEGRIKHCDGRPTDLTIGDIARAVTPGGPLFDGEPALQAACVYEARNVLTSGFSVHVARVRLDPRTGFFRVLDYLVVHDAGRALNRMIVDGQVTGGVADGIGGAMFSEIVYDNEGQLLTASLADYLVVTAPEVPRIRVIHADCPSSTNPLGVRGVGESGIIPVAAVLANAVARAIDPMRTGHERELFAVPLTPERVFRACRLAMRNGEGAATR
jgi:carbon-monoxide dehydrogenase large subunit